MKNFKIFLSVIVSGILLSCSKSEDFTDEGYLKIDYKTELGIFKDLTVTNDNNVYALSVVGSNPEMMALQKVTSTGTKSELSQWDAYHFLAPLLSHNSVGKIYMSNNNLGGKIYSFSNSFALQTDYTFDGAWQYTIRMDGFCNLPDDTFVMFDNNSKKIKRYSPALNSEAIIAGSGNYGTTDGIGTNAEFSWFGHSVSHNFDVYVIDNDRIRKIDCSSPDFTVTTPYTIYNETILDIAVDVNGDIFALVNNKGIYKLSNGSVTVYKNGVENCRTLNDNSLHSIDWKKFNRIYIKNNDLYLTMDYGTLLKISDFRNKL